MSLILELSSGSGYVPRTRENVAQSDVTLAIASDFSTAGERLTYRCAREHHKPIIQIAHNAQGDAFDTGVTVFVKTLNDTREGEGLILNGAGNGAYTLIPAGQEAADAFAWRFLRAALKHPEKRFTLAEVRSGGQTGYDVAIVKAALSCGIPARLHCARSMGGKFLVRGVDGRDVGLTEAEYRRFTGLESLSL